MGAIFSRKKGKESFPELLASLTKEISSLESQQNHLHHQHRLLALFTFLSLVVYVALVGSYIIYIGAPKSALHIGACIGSPILIWLLRWMFKWIVGRRAALCESRLTELRDEKKDVLSRVMDEVPYKTAKELLERYDPQSAHLRQQPQQQQQQQRQHGAAAESSAEGVRQRRPEGAAGGRPLVQGQNIQQQQQLLHQQQLLQHQQQVIANQNLRLRATQERLLQAGDGSRVVSPPEPLPMYELKPGDVAGPAPGPPRPQPILPRDRTNVDKMVEFLVGDGPNNRYALICNKCFSHNGMALASEFEYCTFRCAYCYELNPSRKELNPIQDASGNSQATADPESDSDARDQGNCEDRAPSAAAADIAEVAVEDDAKAQPLPQEFQPPVEEPTAETSPNVEEDSVRKSE